MDNFAQPTKHEKILRPLISIGVATSNDTWDVSGGKGLIFKPDCFLWITLYIKIYKAKSICAMRMSQFLIPRDNDLSKACDFKLD